MFGQRQQTGPVVPLETDRRQLVDDVGAGRIEQQRVAVHLVGLALVVQLAGADLRRLDQDPHAFVDIGTMTAARDSSCRAFIQSRRSR